MLVDRTLGNEDDVTLLDGVDVLVKSPGVPADALLVAVARDRGIPVWSEVELGYRLLPRRARKIVGVTGTNGKTTTTELLGAIFPRDRARRRRRGERQDAADVDPATPTGSCASCHEASRMCRKLRVRRRGAGTRARPSRPAWNVRCVPRREAAHLRAERPREVVPRGSGLAGSSSRRRTSCRPSQSSSAPHNRENAAAATAAARAAGIGDDAIAEALRVPRRAAPAQARRRARGCARQRLQGDERRCRPPCARRVRRRSRCI